MKAVIILAVLDILILLPISDNMGGELLTGFELKVIEEWDATRLVVMNTGPLQATGVILNGSVKELVPLDDGRGCPEGTVVVSGDYIRATFDGD